VPVGFTVNFTDEFYHYYMDCEIYLYASSTYINMTICSYNVDRYIENCLLLVTCYSLSCWSYCVVLYCWQQARECDYEEYIGRSCRDLPMECVFECGEYIARKMMKQHCQQDDKLICYHKYRIYSSNLHMYIS